MFRPRHLAPIAFVFGMAPFACGGLDRLSEQYGAPDADTADRTPASDGVPTGADAAQDASAKAPALCSSEAPAQSIGSVGETGVVLSLALTDKYVFAANRVGAPSGGLYRIAKDGSGKTQLAMKDEVDNLLVVQDRVYFTSTSGGGTLWSCPVEGMCDSPTALGASKEPSSLAFRNGQLYFQDATVARGALINGALGTTTHASFGTPRAFVVDERESVFYLQFMKRPQSYEFWLMQNNFSGAADGGRDIGGYTTPVVLDGSISLPASFEATWAISQSADYVFWGSYSVDSKRGAVIRSPKYASGTQCVYGGVRADSRPYATAVHGSEVFWSNRDVSVGAIAGSVECCPIDGRCCPADPANAPPETAPTKLVKSAQDPAGLAVDDSGVYFASVTSGSVYRIAPR